MRLLYPFIIAEYFFHIFLLILSVRSDPLLWLAHIGQPVWLQRNVGAAHPCSPPKSYFQIGCLPTVIPTF